MRKNFQISFGQDFITYKEKAAVRRAVREALENWDINRYNEVDETYSDEVFVDGKTYRFDVDAKLTETDSEDGLTQSCDMQFAEFVAVTRVQ